MLPVKRHALHRVHIFPDTRVLAVYVHSQHMDSIEPCYYLSVSRREKEILRVSPYAIADDALYFDTADTSALNERGAYVGAIFMDDWLIGKFLIIKDVFASITVDTRNDSTCPPRNWRLEDCVPAKPICPTSKTHDCSCGRGRCLGELCETVSIATHHPERAFS